MSVQEFFSDERTVSIPPFSRQPSGDEVVIGRVETGIFLALPPVAVEILDYLASGRNIGEARAQFRDQYEDDEDFFEFLKALTQQGFLMPQGIRSQDDESPGSSSPEAKRFHFDWLSQRAAGTLFGRPAILFYLALIAAATYIGYRDPALVPGYSALVFENHYTIKLLSVISFSVLTIFIHEMGHLIAAKAQGVSARLGVGNRLWILVAETDLTGLWSIPKSKRFLPIIAGPLVDLVSCSLLIFLFAINKAGFISLSPLALEMLRGIFMVYVLQLLWQLFFFLKTDLYYLFTMAFECKDLMKDTERFLKGVVSHSLPALGRRLRWSTNTQDLLPPREQRVVKFYSFLWLTGRLAALMLLFTISLPLFIDYIGVIFHTFDDGFRGDPGAYIDALALTTIFAAIFLVGMGLWLRSFVTQWKTA